MSHKVTLIPGDGIGPEVTLATRRCIDATGVTIEWQEALAGQPALEASGELLPKATLDSIKKNKVAIKGPIITPIGSGFRSVNVALRHALDLSVCLRPAKTIAGVAAPHKNVDIIVLRENSEDLYAGIEFFQGEEVTDKLISQISAASGQEIRKDSAISIKPISISATRHISRFAFELARKESRKKVTCVHKANIMKATDGLWLHTFKEVAKEYPDIEAGDIIVDNLCMQLVTRPQNFDILVLQNLYGDIISDLCAGLVGGLGVAPGANIGDEYAVFEPVHGSAPKYTGKNKVNPTATILSGVLMLKHLGYTREACCLEKAVEEVIAEGKAVTYDLKADRDDPAAVGTSQMADAIIKKIKSH
ncbi:MAG: isocitrate/isopropylmalate dehydrogenase family protein [Candidatus Omnitrophica bacterium]|nr:isocitrate/isopropylmalate dehydrogenase family protein [Candidatus Omnitrophota bacterium]